LRRSELQSRGRASSNGPVPLQRLPPHQRHRVLAFFNKDQLTISGKTQTHQSTADSGNTRTRHFCPTCGSRLFSENSKAPDTIGIAVGSFDDSDWFRPEVILYVSELPLWDRSDPEIPTHEHM